MVDVRALAVGYVLYIAVITDDKGMIDLAQSLDIKIMRILPLLKIMLKTGYIDKVKIKEVVGWLTYTNDLPYKEFIDDVNTTFDLNL